MYAKYNTEGSAPEDQVKGLFFTPAWYTTGSSGASSNLPKFQQLHEDIEICFTGSDVFSSISNSSATTFKNWIGRTPVMWWNYPVNDAEDSVFFTNPINFDYSQDSNPTNIKGVLSNPMNYSEASKVALFGVADYTWNPQAFDAEQNWYDCFDAIIPALISGTVDAGAAGFSITPERLSEIRNERRPGSRYASLANCREEIAAAEDLMRREGIRWLNSTTKSIEEISATIIAELGLDRRQFV